MGPLELRPLLAIEVRVRPVVVLGGERRYVPFEGGSFEGRDGLRGVVLEGGVDWQSVRPDGVVEIDAHYALRTDEGEGIEVVSRGLRKAEPAVAERLAGGEAVDPGEYYFRTHVRLSTAAPRLGYLNDLLAVSTGERHQSVVHLAVHELL
jgi:Protein of unknown function (DUF3237)